ncbi:MAG: fatty acid desaturase [Proteobacteria bacterium]|nr:fatty acid desaturase [Pseudomonadota bacterium]
MQQQVFLASGPRAVGVEPSDRADLVKALPFFGVHIAALLIFLLPFHWFYPVAAVALYLLRIFGITAGFHRYFSHRAFKTGRGFQFVLAWIGSMSAQKGVLWWAAHHRDHHKHSDEPEDIHSPRQRGLWWAHVGWILSRRYDATKLERIRDFARYPELVWLNRWHLVPPVTLAVALFLAGGLPLLVWGFFLSTVLTWHGTFTINSLSHVFGSRRYATADDSRNNLLLALLTLGEGWHNNHHYYMSTANQGWFWWEVDVTYYLLKLLAWAGVVRDLRTPPRYIRDGLRAPAAEASAEPRAVTPFGTPSLPA